MSELRDGSARPALNFLLRGMFCLLSVALMLLALALLVYAGIQLVQTFTLRDAKLDLGLNLLNTVGFTIIALAVFEVGKYVLEEEVLEPSEMRHVGDARRGMTKFISTIAIAVFLEALVMIFASGKEDVSKLLFPTLLLFGGIALVVGLGIYQRLSAEAERIVGFSSRTRSEAKAAEPEGRHEE